jgi:hypothetical protein
MSITTLAEAKLHLRATHASEDSLIQIYLDASEMNVEDYLNRKLYASDIGSDLTGVLLTAPIKAAVLLFVGHLYNNREAVTMERLNMPMELPMGVKWLLGPYRIEMGV